MKVNVVKIFNYTQQIQSAKRSKAYAYVINTKYKLTMTV